jgi:FHA domain
MQHRLAIKHLSGARARTLDRLAFPREREITFGRDRDCHVRYEESDDLVSRKHLKIVATNEQPVRYLVVDLGSRNGTFVNRQRVFGAVVLSPGGRVQLGPGGPEFEFAPEKTKSHRSRLGKLALVLLLSGAAGAAGYGAWARVTPLWRKRQSGRVPRESKPAFTAAAASAFVAGVEAEWNVFDTQTGARLARAYIANERGSGAERLPLVEGGPATLPVFAMGDDRRIEPLLVPAGTLHAGPAVGGTWTSKGVIVSQTGGALTAAPHPRPWNAPYRWPAQETAGALLVLTSQKVAQVVPLAAAQFPDWTPAVSGFIAEQLPDGLGSVLNGRKASQRDLRVEVTAAIRATGRTWKTKLAGGSSGLWLASTHPGISFAGIRGAPLDDAETRLNKKRPVWIVGNEVEAGEVQEARPDGLIALRSSHCGEGAVVFDPDGRVLALCIPDADAKAGLAVPIRRGLELLSGTTNGFPN